MAEPSELPKPTLKPLVIHPPLLNSANPWCSTLEQLRNLYASPYTGAVTTRTSLLKGFPNDETVHQYTFYNPTTHNASFPNPTVPEATDQTGSLNTLGYSPEHFGDYLEFIHEINSELVKEEEKSGEKREGGYKPFIVSVTGTVDEVVEMYAHICSHQRNMRMVLAMEINLSCPNIPGKPPPAYNKDSLLSYLSALKREVQSQLVDKGRTHIPIGIKTPPYTYHDQYQNLIDALLESAQTGPKDLGCPVSFITATNTLGSSLLLTPQLETLSSPPTSPGGSKSREVYHHTLSSINGTGIGGLAGAPLHPLALGNVYTIKGQLFQHKELEHIQIIGVGGVEDVDGFNRMRAVGAAAVGIGTALGRKGLKVFEDIGEALQGKH